mmetsp:Transcript_22795/g.74429  ORF Transcript_22795/g.74429 Transcript_22795/m.74429 type:complete len:220 (+) Transcript_22795:525-1184(+)
MKETTRRESLQVLEDVIAEVPDPVRNSRVPHEPTVAGNDPILRVPACCCEDPMRKPESHHTMNGHESRQLLAEATQTPLGRHVVGKGGDDLLRVLAIIVQGNDHGLRVFLHLQSSQQLGGRTEVSVEEVQVEELVLVIVTAARHHLERAGGGRQCMDQGLDVLGCNVAEPSVERDVDHDSVGSQRLLLHRRQRSSQEVNSPQERAHGHNQPNFLGLARH